jgi:hypothetical protein
MLVPQIGQDCTAISHYDLRASPVNSSSVRPEMFMIPAIESCSRHSRDACFILIRRLLIN